jgi:hypothetical protein
VRKSIVGLVIRRNKLAWAGHAVAILSVAVDALLGA